MLIIHYRDRLQDYTTADLTVQAGSADAAYPGSNVQALQPGIFCRLDSLASIANSKLDVIASGVRSTGNRWSYQALTVVGITAERHANLLEDGAKLDSSNWTSGADTTLAETTDSALEPDGVPIYKLSGAASPAGTRLRQQVWTAPVADFNEEMVVAGTAKRISGGCHARLYCSSKAGAFFAYVDVNLDTGAILASSSTGFSGVSFAIESKGNGYYRPSIVFTTEEVPDVTARLQVLTSGGSPSACTNEELAIQGMILRRGDTDPGPIDNAGAASLYRVQLDISSSFTSPTYASGWLPVGMEADFRDFTHAAIYHAFPSLRSETHLRLEFWSATHGETFLDVGRLMLGPVWTPTGIVPPGGRALMFEEVQGGGADQVSREGHEFRPIGRTRRLLDLTLEYLSEAELESEAAIMQLRAGRSRPVFVNLDPTEGNGGRHLWAFLAFLESSQPMTHQAYSAARGGIVYRATWRFKEVLP